MTRVREHEDDEDDGAERRRKIEPEATPPDKIPNRKKRPDRLPAARTLLGVIRLIVQVLLWFYLDE